MQAVLLHCDLPQLSVCLCIQMCCGSSEVWLYYSDDIQEEVQPVYMPTLAERMWLHGVVLQKNWMWGTRKQNVWVKKCFDQIREEMGVNSDERIRAGKPQNQTDANLKWAVTSGFPAICHSSKRENIHWICRKYFLCIFHISAGRLFTWSMLMLWHAFFFSLKWKNSVSSICQTKSKQFRLFCFFLCAGLPR